MTFQYENMKIAFNKIKNLNICMLTVTQLIWLLSSGHSRDMINQSNGGKI